jgi:polyhydroxybutyrate depolymerase
MPQNCYKNRLQFKRYRPWASAIMIALALNGCGGGSSENNAMTTASVLMTPASTIGTPQTLSINYAGIERTYIVYAPIGLPSAAVPLVLMLHGGSGTSQDVMEGTVEGKWNQIADREKLIVAYPQGLTAGGRTGWNDCRNDKSTATITDDVGFLSEVVNAISGRYSVDAQRVYASGHSNGAMMALRLGIEASQKFAAIHSNSGLVAAVSKCPTPTKPISVMLSTGTLDPIVPYLGGAVQEGSATGNGTVLSAANSVAYFTNLNGLTAAPLSSSYSDIVTTDASTVTSFTYGGGTNGTEVLFLRENGAGHAWASANPLTLLMQAIVGKKNQDIDTSEEAWKFFKRHTLGR